MKMLFASDKVCVGKSRIPNAGRGVYAKCDIKRGEIIENCPIIEVSKNDTSVLGESSLVTYFFYYGKGNAKSAVALGFGSIYNHSYTPNAKYKIKTKEKLIVFIALLNIKKDTEITVNYSGDNRKNEKIPLWFE